MDGEVRHHRNPFKQTPDQFGTRPGSIELIAAHQDKCGVSPTCFVEHAFDRFQTRGSQLRRDFGIEAAIGLAQMPVSGLHKPEVRGHIA
jgi:hypothetical protein